MKTGIAALAVVSTVWLTPLAAGPLQVTDDRDRKITLARPAQRIVSLAPHITELLFAAGAGDKVVGAVEYSDYPPPARNIPRVGSYTRVDLERLLALKPDLVIGWSGGNRRADLEQLEKLGLTLHTTELRRLEDVAGHIERYGELAGSVAVARRAAEAFRARRAALQRRYGARPVVRMLYEIWNQPLMTVNGDHVISDVMRLCGGENVFAGLALLAPSIDVEAVLGANPEVIVASGMNDERPEWLDDWRRYPALQAVRRDNLFFIPPDLLQRHTPRLLDGAEQLCRALDAARVRR